jgi:hypothetical protein
MVLSPRFGVVMNPALRRCARDVPPRALNRQEKLLGRRALQPPVAGGINNRHVRAVRNRAPVPEDSFCPEIGENSRKSTLLSSGAVL